MLEVVDVLLANLEAAYVQKGWHGPTLRGSLRGLTAEEVTWRPAARRHNIAEMAMHCAYWKYAVRRKLTGEKRGSFPVRGSNWFSVGPGEFGFVVKLLDAQHAKLRETIESLPARDFGDEKKVRLIYGVAAHDLYHAGQIQLIKRLHES